MRCVRRLVGAGLAALALAGPATAVAADPGAPGPYAVRHVSYALPAVRIAGLATPVEVEGDVMLPVGATGPRPLVVVLHGRHRTCRRPGHSGIAEGAWPCPAGWTAVPSHRGYRWLTRQLASQGDIAVSVSANGVNAQDDVSASSGAVERARLVRHHLALWATWNATGGDPWGGAAKGRVDLGRVVLAGHSRGGEAVAQAAALASPGDPWRIRGLALLAPTAFGRQVTPGVDEAVVLPYCDGDVDDLQGQAFVDARRDVAGDTSVRSAALVMGADHNGFNTVWATDGPDAEDWRSTTGVGDDAVCERPGRAKGGGRRPSARITAGAQRAAARAVVGALVRASTDDDPDAVALLDGSAPMPPSAGSATVFVSAAAGGGGRVLYAPRRPRPAPAAQRVAVRICRGYRTPAGGPVCTPDLSATRQTHWTQVDGEGPFPAPLALELGWRRAGGTVTLPVAAPAAPDTDVSGATAVALRLVLDPAVTPARLALRLTDAAGRTVDVRAVREPVRLPGPRADGMVLPRLWAQTVRFPLDPAAADLSRIRSMRLVTLSATGHAWVLDVAAVATAPRPVAGVAVARLSAATVTMREPGDGGDRVVRVPITVDGQVAAAGRVAVRLTTPGGRTTWRQLAVPVGATRLSVPVHITADRRRTGTRRWAVALMAPAGVVVGRYDGGVVVLDDEPPIRIGVVPRTVTVREGEPLVWRLRLSRPAPEQMSVFLEPVTLPPDAAVLDTADVPDTGITGGIAPAGRRVRLDESYLAPYVAFERGSRTAEVRLATRADGVRERPERVVLRFSEGGDGALVPRARTLTGVVRDR